MNKISLISSLCILLAGNAIAQGPSVPGQLQFAGMELRLTESLRKELQTEVDALTRSEKYFNIKVERARQYFPIIERIFKEENVPEDIKYLVIQESALISDAVSSSDAVGFWQFKEGSGKEVGFRIDRQVDERLNIVSATRGAARYLKTNHFYFKNWIYAILAYNTGRGGAEAHIQKKYVGAHKMDLDNNTHWYLKKFLAHMIAFGNRLKESGSSPVRLSEYTGGGGKTLNQIAVEFHVESDELLLYNKWLKTSRVPEDKIYAVIIPGIREVKTIAVDSKREPEQARLSPNMSKYPVIRKVYGKDTRVIRINGIQGVIGINGDHIQDLATLGGISIGQFLKYNDISIDHKIRHGQVYYLKPKKRKAKEYYHTILPGENLWIISQKYGIRLDQLMMKNRLRKDEEAKKGMVLYIRYIRPENEEIAYNPIPSVSSMPVASAMETPDTLDVLNQDTDFVENDLRAAEFQESSLNDAGKERGFIQEDAKGNSASANEIKTAPDTLASVPLLHVVSEGETLYGIAKKYNMPIALLMEINEIGPGDKIKTGQQLYLKNPEAGIEIAEEKEQNIPEPYISYEVRKGDTLYNLSKKFNVSVEEIMDWNEKDTMQLNIGEKLKILKRSND